MFTSIWWSWLQWWYVIEEEIKNFSILVFLILFLVKCNKGVSAGLICFNGGSCNNESESCNCRAGYQDLGSGCLLSSLEKLLN